MARQRRPRAQPRGARRGPVHERVPLAICSTASRSSPGPVTGDDGERRGRLRRPAAHARRHSLLRVGQSRPGRDAGVAAAPPRKGASRAGAACRRSDRAGPIVRRHREEVDRLQRSERRHRRGLRRRRSPRAPPTSQSLLPHAAGRRVTGVDRIPVQASDDDLDGGGVLGGRSAILQAARRPGGSSTGTATSGSRSPRTAATASNKDQFNRVEFDPVTTTAVRIEVEPKTMHYKTGEISDRPTRCSSITRSTGASSASIEWRVR